MNFRLLIKDTIRKHFASSNIWELSYVLARVKIRSRYIGSLIGFAWPIANAALPLVTYVIVFFFIAKVRVPGYESPYEYLIYVFSGLIPWLFLSRVITESPDLINNNLDILRQAIFPVQVLGLVLCVETTFTALIQISLILILAFVANSLSPLLILLPIYLLLLFLLALGLSWLLSIMGLLIRDVKEVLAALLPFLLFLTPVFYSVDQVPDVLRPLIEINPISYSVEVFRDIVIYGSVRDTDNWLYLCLFAGSFLLGGYLIMHRFRREVADFV